MAMPSHSRLAGMSCG